MRTISSILLISILFAATPSSAQKKGTRGQNAKTETFNTEQQKLYQVNLLPQYRHGSTVSQISSYDTTGGNDDGFNGRYSYRRKEGAHLVLADLKGPGVIQRIWTPTPTQTTVAFYFDGEKTPRLRLPFIALFNGTVEPFTAPLAGNEVGGYYSYVPIPYSKSVKIVYEGTDIRFHQIQYRTYATGTVAKSFDPSGTTGDERTKIAALWNAVGKRPWTIVPYGDSIRITERKFTLEAGSEVPVFNMEQGGRIVGIEIERTGKWDRTIWLDAQWDADDAPAILAPVDDFFGYAFGSPAAQSLLLGSISGRDYCYMPMPFEKNATVKLKSADANGSGVSGTIRIFFALTPLDKNSEGKLYTIARQEKPVKGKPYVIADVQGQGHYVGTLLQTQGLKPGITVFFEGDDVTTVDGKMIMHGTGSEDYFNGGWYWILDRWDKGVSLPLHGALEYSLPHGRTGGYRFYLSDKVPFEREYKLTMEHGPEGNAIEVEYTSVAFYYGDQPENITAPARAASQYSPSIFEFYPRDFPVQIGPGTTVHFPGHNAMEIKAGIQSEDFKVDDSDKVEAKGMVRADLSSIPPGRYRIFISYQRHPEGSVFSLWRRQEQLSDWIDTHAEERSDVTRSFVATVTLTDQVRSLTFKTRLSAHGGSVLRFDRLILERVEAD